jgi:hypothetical protein
VPYESIKAIVAELALIQAGSWTHPLLKVRKTPSWPRSWTNFSLL